MKIKLELELNDVNKIIFALAEQPYKLVADLISLVRSQAESQVNPQPSNESEKGT